MFDIDWNYRPESYWTAPDPLSKIVGNVKGTTRRKMIEDAVRNHTLDDMPDELLQDTLEEDVRLTLGQVHPQLMGGEYLPDYSSDEIEIARVSMKSTTGDVISIRARKLGDRIRYSVVDEYAMRFVLQKPESEMPLTMSEIVDLIDSVRWGSEVDESEEQTNVSEDAEVFVGLTSSLRDLNIDSGIETMADFVSVTSVIYPQLETHYLKEAKVWYISHWLEQDMYALISGSWEWEGDKLVDSEGDVVAYRQTSRVIWAGDPVPSLLKLSPVILKVLLGVVISNWRQLPLEVISEAESICRQLQ